MPRLTRALLLVALTMVSLGLLAPPGFGQARWPTQKISGWIYSHQAERAAASQLLGSARVSQLSDNGLNPQYIDREDCILYVYDRMSDADIAALDAQGIHVEADEWVPPIPGQHPYGFYLATVEYASLSSVEADARIVYLETGESQSKATNDVGGALIGAVSARTKLSRDGTGVNLAIADSGMDTAHPDFPTPVEAFDMTDGTNPATWGTNVANTVTPHGTHVVGTALGRGTQSGGKYAGSAPGANLYFYKIANDVNGTATATDEIEAINRAAAVGCDVFTMSFGGLSGNYFDGSEATEQAIDVAVAGGMTVFISAGNNRGNGLHHSENVAPNTTNGAFNLTVQNNNAGTNTGNVFLQLVWRDGVSDNNVALACGNLAAGEGLAQNFSGTSTRGTEGRGYTLTLNLAGNTTKNYSLTLQNTAASGNTPLVHVYLRGTPNNVAGSFPVADDNYTINVPADADNAIAVGAWVHRQSWTTFQGNVRNFLPAQTVGTLATFSSYGPRVDGTMKPDVVAPGSATISTRDGNAALANNNNLIIDNDGLNQNGSGPAQYYVMQGTSMASPSAAGAAALLVQEDNTFTPAQIKTLLESTASNAGSPNSQVGYGLINVYTALCTLDDDPPTITCPGDITVECTAPGGTPADDPAIAAFLAGATATDGCTASPKITNDAGTFFAVGKTKVTFTAEDDKGNKSNCAAYVTVEDTKPPTIDVTLSRNALWPPNHKWAPIKADVEVTDVCDPNPVFVLTSITSNEPENGTGDGDTAPDITGAGLGTDDLDFSLRSERAGTGSGRVYTVIYTVTDGSGNSASDTAYVTVPHDQSAAASAAVGFSATGTALTDGADRVGVALYSSGHNAPTSSSDPAPVTFSEDGPDADLPKKVPDASHIDWQNARIGNLAGEVQPLSKLVGDMNGDHVPDIVLYYPGEAVAKLAATDPETWGNVGLRFALDDGTSYLVKDIFALGAPVAIGTATELPSRGGPGTPGGLKPTSSTAVTPEAATPTVTRLAGIYPNPFHQRATIELDLAQRGSVRLSVFGPRGERVRTLLSGERDAGKYFLEWDGSNEAGNHVAPGIYFVQMIGPSVRDERKVVILQ